MIIQIILILAASILVTYALTNRDTHSGRAGKKIALMLLAVGMIIAVLFPGITNNIANLFGVGRGADLLLYLTVVVFIFYVLNNYLSQQKQRDEIYRLARKLAVLDAKERYRIKK